MNENNGGSRLDRIEAMMEGLVDAHLWLEKSQKDLLRSQILLTGEHERTEKKLQQLAEYMAESKKETDKALTALAESQQRTDDALTALMGTVEEIIRSGK